MIGTPYTFNSDTMDTMDTMDTRAAAFAATAMRVWRWQRVVGRWQSARAKLEHKAKFQAVL